MSHSNRAPAPFGPLPSSIQLAYQRKGMIGFAHFGVNTFSGSEWGDGTEPETLFAPSALDADQWARAFASAGFGHLILTCKHHDGFCLWPSRLTRHSVAGSPWRGGRGDLVRDLSEACRRAGIGFGVYLSPWDRNAPSYGAGAAYNDYYLGQLEELLSGYGKVDEVWFDGAKGPGVDQGYDTDRWISRIRSLQPQAAIFSESGPDVRWIGNEEGVAGETCWSKLSPKGGISGSDTALLKGGDPRGSAWLVGECDVSIRPGWFYHAEEDGKVKGQDELFDLYLKSVGRNAVLLLNVPPNREGLLAPPDVASLASLGDIVRDSFGEDLAAGARVSASSRFGDCADYGPEAAACPDESRYWAPAEDERESWLLLEFSSPRAFDAIQVEEYVELGQRISAFRIEARSGGSWRSIARGTTLGFKRILRLAEVCTCDAIRLVIEDSLATPLVRRLSLHRLALQH
jgi:Alpha-L-fucosidase